MDDRVAARLERQDEDPPAGSVSTPGERIHALDALRGSALVIALVLLVLGAQIVTGFGIIPGLLALGYALAALGVPAALGRHTGRSPSPSLSLGRWRWATPPRSCPAWSCRGSTSSAVVALTLGIALVQIAWSRPWFRSFRYGPVEWAWRCCTRLQLAPIRVQDESRLGGSR